MNSVQVLGRLTSDPELKYTQGSKAVCQFTIAHNPSKEEADFYDCVAWEKTAENISNYFKKGQRILIDGRLQQDKWKDQQSGENRSKIKIIVNRFDFIEPASENTQRPATQQSAPPPGAYAQPPAAPPAGYYGQAPQGYPPQAQPQQHQQQQMFNPPPAPAPGYYSAPPNRPPQGNQPGAYPPPAQAQQQSPWLYDQQGNAVAREVPPGSMDVPF
ncbi:single-stranded DNA-binding protein [Dehalobacter sp.]|uniref:single-stranded DNA-binding protein n=1 Tax=Dehalobacter sp. TaxID=1962289 RepID=UPI00258A9327|nr:single-stranded DNA-binding protein [Dehalobacter sp.]MDJ0305371.1 single-stranded DNA-binding protein [Dehalobacter sp.]